MPTIVTLRKDVVGKVAPAIVDRQAEQRVPVVSKPFAPHPEPDRRFKAPSLGACAPVPLDILRRQAHELPQHGALSSPGRGLGDFVARVEADRRDIATGNLQTSQQAAVPDLLHGLEEVEHVDPGARVVLVVEALDVATEGPAEDVLCEEIEIALYAVLVHLKVQGRASVKALEEVDRVLEDFGVEGAVVFGVDVGVPLGGECVVEHGGLDIYELGVGYAKLGLEDEADVGLLFGGGRVR